MTHYPHVIELRGPWRYVVVAPPTAVSRDGGECGSVAAVSASASAATETATGHPPPERQATMPASWDSLLGPDFRGQVRLRRRFSRPGQLDPHERLWLIIVGDGVGRAYLDGALLGAIGGAGAASPLGRSQAFDITDAAHAAHGAGRKLELEIELERPPAESSRQTVPGGGPSGERRIVDVRLEVRLVEPGGAGP